jgi:hypothetical protein
MPELKVSIQPPEDALRKMREVLTPQQFKQAAFQAVKRTTAKAEKQVENAIAEATTIKKSRAVQGVWSTLTKGDVPVGIVAIRRRPLPASYFKHTASKRAGIAAVFTRGGGAVAFGHGFKRTVTTAGVDGTHSGHVGLFVRAKRLPGKGPNLASAKMVQSGKYKGQIAARFTLKEIFAPPLIDIVTGTNIAAEITASAGEEMQRQLTSQINRFMKVPNNG